MEKEKSLSQQLEAFTKNLEAFAQKYKDEIKLGSGEVEGCYLETYNFMYNDLTSNYNRYILTSENFNIFNSIFSPS